LHEKPKKEPQNIIDGVHVVRAISNARKLSEIMLKNGKRKF